MIYLTVALVLSLVLNGVVVYATNLTLRRKDELSFKEREQILQRIQSPISAVSLHAQDQINELEGTSTFTLPYDDDKAMEDFLQAGEVNGQ